MLTNKTEDSVQRKQNKHSKTTEFDVWMAKYGPVERDIFKIRERRIQNQEKRNHERFRKLGDLCEATEGLAKEWARSGSYYEIMYDLVKNDPWTLQCFLRYARSNATRKIKHFSDAVRRPLYYAQENARRRALAAERRKITRRRTTNPCPTREQIIDAWIHRRDSHDAALHFGSIVMDLECYLDNSLLFTERGSICGRRGGIKRWLQEEIPALYLRYTTVMRFKAMAKKVRQIVELADPIPAAVILETPSPDRDTHRGAEASEKADNGHDRTDGKRDYVAEKFYCTAKPSVFADGEGASDANPDKEDRIREMECNGFGGGVSEDGGGRRAGHELRSGDQRREIAILRARAIWLEATAGIGWSPTALMARVDALLDPENVEEANMLARWREKYANEITVRRRKSWVRRLFESRTTRSA